MGKSKLKSIEGAMKTKDFSEPSEYMYEACGKLYDLLESILIIPLYEKRPKLTIAPDGIEVDECRVWWKDFWNVPSH